MAVYALAFIAFAIDLAKRSAAVGACRMPRPPSGGAGSRDDSRRRSAIRGIRRRIDHV